MAKFKVGEIAIALGSSRPTTDCEIIEYRGEGLYLIRVPGVPSTAPGGYWLAREQNLRKKKPPEEKGSWEEVQEITGWNPTKAPVQ